ncbi:right-handed parallel beta-helix repeat-containing protein [Natronosalvus halobius]|uniref:right-handed parallel beta-helix repeat-containing protein n=1 Tax=Natronosalvus halobius TaxID=2953746 RepID=UPI00209F3594|nr:right-handed parallel beta-helix repeat-containing protein [Natronosalvus halobius]USZ71701.1 right-handed parallel beta-helix repeat-containing protein [Natronosalvus halobius]
MARDSSVRNDDSAAGHDGKVSRDGNTTLLDRRSYLKLASASAVAGPALAAATGNAAAADYDVITVPAGQREVIRVESNETLENTLVDVTADGATVTIAAHGTNWTIRNVGIEGRVTSENAVFGVSDRQGGTSRIENVYLGDGATDGHRHGVGLWVAPQHNGHIEIDRVNISEMGDNSFYCSAPGYNGAGGTVDISNCYSRDSWVSHFRLGEGSVTNCTAVNTSAHKDGRGIWAWAPGEVTVQDCNLAMNGRHYSVVVGANGGSSTVQMVNTQYDTGYNSGFRRASGAIDLESGNGTSPEDVVPEGCPTSAEEAASGNASGSESRIESATDRRDSAESADLPNVIVFDGRDASTATTDYAFTVTGDLESSTDEGATIDEESTVDGSSAEGVVANYLDAYRFDGELETLRLDGDAAVRVNGVEIDPSEFDDRLENVLLVEGTDADVTRYEFVVDGEIVPSNYEGATIDDTDTIEDGHVHGTVANWKDAFRFDGDLEQLTVDGPGTVSLNGEDVDPGEYGEDLPNVLEIEGTGEPASYEVTVEGTIAYEGDDDEVTVRSGTAVQSSILDGSQRYQFSGAVTDVTFTDGVAAVRLNDDAVDPDETGDDELLPHVFVVDGTNADGPSTYSLQVDGRIRKADYRNASIDEGDLLEDSTVRGAVSNWLDAYWFDGDLEDFTLLGDAEVDVVYNARDQ